MTASPSDRVKRLTAASLGYGARVGGKTPDGKPIMVQPGLPLHLPPDAHAKLLAHQNGVCSICGKAPDNEPGGAFRTDWDGATREARGLLCVPCYRGVKFFEDDPARLRAAAAYLEG